MKTSISRLVLVTLSAAAFTAATLTAQTPLSSTVGVVTAIDAAAREILVKSDAGAEVRLTLAEKASFRRVAPGETDLRNAATIALTEINPGDRVLARGKPSDDQKSVTATLVVVMSKSDIANKQAQERADWDRRGIVGVVTGVSGDEISANIRGPAGTKSIIIVPAKDVVIRRYAADSVKFADAKPSPISAIRVGDQLRARGDKSEDGVRMTADEIVSGSFRTIAAIVNSVDAGGNALRVTNLDGKKPMVVVVNTDSILRKLPPQVAQTLAGRNRPQGESAPSDAPAPAADNAGRDGRGGGDLLQMLERTPKITLADLKPGDAIIVSSTEGTAPDQITAINLVAGVEPILTAPGRKELALGSWSLDMDAGGGQ